MTADRHSTAGHWDAAYEKGATAVSWHQERADIALALIEDLALPAVAPIIDVGGGASPLTAALLDRGHVNLSVLDISQTALDIARAALGARGDDVTWIRADLRDWEPPHAFSVWHDRAVLHFLTNPDEQRAYARLVARAVAPGGYAIIATFAPDGPEQCSGLPVQRYAASDLEALLGDAFTTTHVQREEHTTPSGRTQAFTWVVARRTSGI